MFGNSGTTGHAQTSSLFQCRSSSDGQVFTPTIPDFYFSDENIRAIWTGSNRNLSLIGLEPFIIVFTIPALSAERDCSGTIVAIQYCYRARNQTMNVNVFDFLVLTQNGRQLYINSSFSVYTTPRDEICTLQNQRSLNLFCCDQFNITPSHQIQLSNSNFTYGVVTRDNNTRPLNFRSARTTEYNVEPTYVLRPLEDNLNLGRLFLENQQPRNRSLLLLRFLIGMIDTLFAIIYDN